MLELVSDAVQRMILYSQSVDTIKVKDKLLISVNSMTSRKKFGLN